MLTFEPSCLCVVFLSHLKRTKTLMHYKRNIVSALACSCDVNDVIVWRVSLSTQIRYGFHFQMCRLWTAFSTVNVFEEDQERCRSVLARRMDRTAPLLVGPQTCAKLKVLTYVSEQRSLYYFKNARAADFWPFICSKWLIRPELILVSEAWSD